MLPDASCAASFVKDYLNAKNTCKTATLYLSLLCNKYMVKNDVSK